MNILFLIFHNFFLGWSARPTDDLDQTFNIIFYILTYLFY